MKNFNIILFSFLVCACSTSRVKTHYLSKNDFSNINFIEGMKGCENLHLSKNSLDIFVTDLTGKLYLISGTSHENLNVVKLLRINDYVLGIDEGSDKYLYVLSSSKEWLKKGGGINKIDVNLGKQEKITFDFAGVNGLAIDNQNNIYFTVGNMNMLKPKGAIYIMKALENNKYDTPIIFIENLKSPNGLFYDKKNNSLIFTEVFSGVKSINLENNKIKSIFGKTRLIEGFDDLCVDSKGNYWVADQPNGFIKMYNSHLNQVKRFLFKEFGVASSCRIRIDDGKEFIYVTEIKKNKNSKEYDGRGVIIIPIDLLLKL